MNKNIFTQDKWNVGITYIPEKFIHMRHLDYNNDLHVLNYSSNSYISVYDNLKIYNLHEQDIETTIELNAKKVIERYNKLYGSIRPIFACRRKDDKYTNFPQFIEFSHEEIDGYGDYYSDYGFSGKIDYNVRFKRGIYFFEYARYQFFEKIQKYDKEIVETQSEESMKKPSKFGFFGNNRKLKSEQLMDKRDSEIDYYLEEYFKWFDKQFITLKIPSHYLETLKKATYIGLKFDIRKPIILLDNFIEKIYEFFIKAKDMNLSAMQLNLLIDKSLDSFIAYTEDKIKEMNDFKAYNVVDDGYEYSEEDLLLVEQIQKELF